MPKTLAIIPCYNEEASIKTTIDTLKSSDVDVNFIVVNDGSSDDTLNVCIDNNYPIINMPFNLGLASAVQVGMRYAYINDYDMALQFDGDGQHLPEYIPEMVRLMQESSADIVVGSRYTKKSSKGLRGFGGKILRTAVKISTGKTLTDPTSGLRLFNRKMIKRFATEMNHGPEPDTLAYLISQGIKVIEIPVTMQERKAGESYLSALNAANYMLRMFVSIIVIQWFRPKEGSR